MTEKAEPYIDKLVAGVLDGPGELPNDVRRAIEARTAELSGREGPAPDVLDELTTLIDKIAQHAYKVTDGDIQVLKDTGYSEDAIFEAIVAAALGAGRARFECGIAVLEGRK